MQALTHTTYHTQHIQHMAMENDVDLLELRKKIRDFYNNHSHSACLPLHTAAFYKFELFCKNLWRSKDTSNLTCSVTLDGGLKLMYSNNCVELARIVFSLPLHPSENSDTEI
jgi:hypothetical protein